MQKLLLLLRLPQSARLPSTMCSCRTLPRPRVKENVNSQTSSSWLMDVPSMLTVSPREDVRSHNQMVIESEEESAQPRLTAAVPLLEDHMVLPAHWSLLRSALKKQQKLINILPQERLWRRLTQHQTPGHSSASTEPQSSPLLPLLSLPQHTWWLELYELTLWDYDKGNILLYNKN